jgi:menaquinone reductase, multiheme cytochrome c subunit
VRVKSIGFFLLGVIAALAAGWLAFPRALYRTSVQPLQFSHKAHSGDAVGLGCSDCHTITADGRFGGIPPLEKCAGCHSEPVTKSADEEALVKQYVKPGKEIPWRVYSRQPENVYFSHATHVNLGKLQCERCHGEHGKSDKLRAYEENRITGYSRDIWGASISRIKADSGRPGMKMDDCTDCHRDRQVASSCLDCHK